MVYDPLFQLCDGGVAKYGQLSENLFIVTAGVEFHDEVAALCPDDSGVNVGLDVQSEVVRPVGLFFVCDIQFSEQSCDGMIFLHIGVDIYMATHSDGQWLIQKPHLIKVGFGEVGTDGGL